MRPWETIMRTGLIYKLTSKTTNKSYVGQTINLKNRLRKHKHDKVKNPKTNSLQYDLQRYGFSDFKLTIIEDNIPPSKLDDCEKYWIEKLDTITHGYNIAKGGHGGDTYHGFNKKDREALSNKLSQAKTGDDCAKFLGYKHGHTVSAWVNHTRCNQKELQISQNIIAPVSTSRDECSGGEPLLNVGVT